jgi:hypothetical protein
MPTLLLTDNWDRTYVVCQPCRRWERLRARIRSWDLDNALARGACPDSRAVLSLRANKLISASTRSRLAREVRRLIRQAERPPHRWSEAAPICWNKVRRAEPVLAEVADHLAGPDPLDAMGIAQVLLLLRDGAGPVFSRPYADDLKPALVTAIEALEPRPVHSGS